VIFLGKAGESCYYKRMEKNTNWTIRTRHFISGHYHEASYFGMTKTAAGSIALADHPNSEIVGVWPW
jgi:hypothetical protein